MTSLATPRAFAEMVEANDLVGAIEQFYAAPRSARTTIHRFAAAKCLRKEAAGIDASRGREDGATRAGAARPGSHSDPRALPVHGQERLDARDGGGRWQTWCDKELIDEHFFDDPGALKNTVAGPASATDRGP